MEIEGLVSEFEVLVDTGFEGELVVPRQVVRGLPPGDFSQWILADGSLFSAPTYRGVLHVGSFPPFPVTVVAVDSQPILGRGVTDRFMLILDHGREVRLQL